MSRMTMCVFSVMYVLVSPLALADDSASPPVSDRYARKCQRRSPSRKSDPQGTMLWGTRQRWDERSAKKDSDSVLVTAELDSVVQSEGGVSALDLDRGRMVASSAAGKSITNAVLRGIDSEGKPVEVAICGAEPSPDDPETVWYQIEAWNPVAQDWENPCVSTGQVPNPRALVVSGVWDEDGAHREVKGKVTFACENGVISKCASWGYKPWASRDGRSLADVHQACTRMARADYCGNGKSHTREATLIEYYDSLGVSSRATTASREWDPARAAFEAAWAPDGAMCLARTRHGEPLAAILKECPKRFQKAEVDLGDGDRCTLQRPDASLKAALLRNRVRAP